MSRKQKTITLTYPEYYGDNMPRDKGYGVAQITDSTDFTPGQVLTATQVNELCSNAAWKVIMKSRN